MSTVPRLSMSAMQGPEAAWEPCGDCRAAQGPGDGEGRACCGVLRFCLAPLGNHLLFPVFVWELFQVGSFF